MSTCKFPGSGLEDSTVSSGLSRLTRLIVFPVVYTTYRRGEMSGKTPGTAGFMLGRNDGRVEVLPEEKPKISFIIQFTSVEFVTFPSHDIMNGENFFRNLLYTPLNQC